MFNDFKLSDSEVIKILNEYDPLILKASVLKKGLDEDLMQEIKLMIYKELTKKDVKKLIKEKEK